MITLLPGPFFTFLIDGSNGSRLVQHDADFQGVASTFGWKPPQGKTTDELIWAAYEFLDRNVGTTVEDPGYLL